MKKIIISALSVFLLTGITPAHSELIKGTKSYQTKTYLGEDSRPKPKPPVPVEMGSKDPAQIEPAAGEEIKGTRPYEVPRHLPKKIKVPQKD